MENKKFISNDDIVKYINRVKADPSDTVAWDNILLCAEKCIFFVLNKRIFDRSFHNDVLQDIRIRIFRKIHTYNENKAKFSTWVVAVSNNYCNTWLKKNTVKREDDDDNSSIDIGDVIEILKDPVNIQEKVVVKNIILDSLKEVKDSIDTPKKYLAFVLVQIDGYSKEECSRILKVPVTTVNNWVHRVKLKVVEVLQKNMGLTIKAEI